MSMSIICCNAFSSPVWQALIRALLQVHRCWRRRGVLQRQQKTVPDWRGSVLACPQAQGRSICKQTAAPQLFSTPPPLSAMVTNTLFFQYLLLCAAASSSFPGLSRSRGRVITSKQVQRTSLSRYITSKQATSSVIVNSLALGISCRFENASNKKTSHNGTSAGSSTSNRDERSTKFSVG